MKETLKKDLLLAIMVAFTVYVGYTDSPKIRAEEHRKSTKSKSYTTKLYKNLRKLQSEGFKIRLLSSMCINHDDRHVETLMQQFVSKMKSASFYSNVKTEYNDVNKILEVGDADTISLFYLGKIAENQESYIL